MFNHEQSYEYTDEIAKAAGITPDTNYNDLPFDIYEYTDAIEEASRRLTQFDCECFYEDREKGDLGIASAAKLLSLYLNPAQNPKDNIRCLLEFAETRGIHLGKYRFVYAECTEEERREVEVECLASEFPWGNEVISCTIVDSDR